MKAVKEFFDNHPGCDEVHESLGYLFTNKDDADKMLAGVTGEGKDVLPPILHNDATTYGKSAGEIEAINKQTKKEEPKKESAKAAPKNAAKAEKKEDKSKPSGK